jgi:hypothetical protein
MTNHKGIWGKIMMALCVGGPIIGWMFLMIGRSGGNSVRSYLPFAFFLLCPLSHLLMMRFMHKDNDNGLDKDRKNSGPSCH